MEFIAAAVVMLAIFVPVFLLLEVATPHAVPARLPAVSSPEAAAAKYLASHPLKPQAPATAANDSLERIAA